MFLMLCSSYDDGNENKIHMDHVANCLTLQFGCKSEFTV